MKLKIKKLVDNAVIPSRAREGDAGLDLTAVSMQKVDEGNHGYIEYDLGLSMEIESGYVGLIYPRSSISKTGLWMANGVGVIDSGYRGPIKVRFKHIPNTDLYSIGDRVAQLVIQKQEDVDIELLEELSTSERSDGGFGSTGS